MSETNDQQGRLMETLQRDVAALRGELDEARERLILGQDLIVRALNKRDAALDEAGTLRAENAQLRTGINRRLATLEDENDQLREMIGREVATAAEETICPACSGTGTIEQGPVDGRCQRCRGTGLVDAHEGPPPHDPQLGHHVLGHDEACVDWCHACSYRRAQGLPPDYLFPHQIVAAQEKEREDLERMARRASVWTIELEPAGTPASRSTEDLPYKECSACGRTLPGAGPTRPLVGDLCWERGDEACLKAAAAKESAAGGDGDSPDTLEEVLEAIEELCSRAEPHPDLHATWPVVQVAEEELWRWQRTLRRFVPAPKSAEKGV